MAFKNNGQRYALGNSDRPRNEMMLARPGGRLALRTYGFNSLSYRFWYVNSKMRISQLMNSYLTQIGARCAPLEQ
jgi:hypothetical protein